MLPIMCRSAFFSNKADKSGKWVNIKVTAWLGVPSGIAGPFLIAGRSAVRLCGQEGENKRLSPELRNGMHAIGTLLEEVMMQMRGEAGISGVRIHAWYAASTRMALVWGAASELKQIFQRVLRDAVDAMSGSGSLIVTVRASGSHLHVGVSHEGGRMAHVPSESLRHCRRRLEKVGGHLLVAGASGNGTAVEIQLPLFESQGR